MSGTVLSTLCSICHTEQPKYKCPRCGARTCSLPCIQKHKTRADCDGVRNPRAFKPLSLLKTDAGIDHDFNFLRSIERARQQAEKDVVEARQLLSEKELRPRNEDKQFQKVWYGDELHHVPVQHQPYNKKHGRSQEGPSFIDGFDKHARRRLRYLGIEAITMPKGMARQRENKTAWNRRTQTLNWQVEWLVYNASDLGFPSQQDEQQPLRILCKSLEGTPLNTALASTLDWHRGQLDRQSRQQQQQHDPTETDDEIADPDDFPSKKRKTHHHGNGNCSNSKKPQPKTQNPTTTTWPAAPYPSQDPPTSAWSSTATVAGEEEPITTKWQFFLLKAGHSTTTTASTTTTTTTGKVLIPLASTETLTTALTGRTVVEFPTIVVLPAGMVVAERLEGFRLGSAERRQPPPPQPPQSARHSAEGGLKAGREGGGGDNNRKRGFEGGYKNQDRGQGRDRDRGRGRGQRGGKRAKFDATRRSSTTREVVAEEPEPRSEAEEGEVDSDGGGAVVAGASGGNGNGGVMDVDGSDSATMVGEEQEEEEGEIQQGRPRGGLVDYGSSDESD
ncbi:hypothetical protein C8A00DRAFT_15838 [Chaetomidium leptoderma]|uniref:Box C/D snoRNA protein 1 n=1 Tax=Chaetomidium leptoderma TaxID=669021 RepID=A0AAN6VMD6_9PEZI|nr:hypothetical protein C8A00DRAFT_15838 [Chaetomidium leptoderma]